MDTTQYNDQQGQQSVGAAVVSLSGVKVGGDQNTGDGTQDTGDHVSHDGNLQVVDTGVSGCLIVTTHETNLLAVYGVVHDEVDHSNHSDEDEQNHRNLTNTTIGKILIGIRQTSQSGAGGDTQADTTVQLQTAQSNQHGRNL